MKIALFGANGKLGGVIRGKFEARAGESVAGVICPGRGEVDLEIEGETGKWLERAEVDAVVNCAAMSSLEACEADPLQAHRVNVMAVEEMAWYCRQRGARLIHFSTDYVLDGRHEGLKGESAKCRPVNMYGESKLEAETRVLEICPWATVARVSWLHGNPERPGLAESIAGKFLAGERVELVGDKWSKPTWCRDIATWTEMALEQGGERGSEAWAGVMHWVNSGDAASWADYGQAVLEILRGMGRDCGGAGVSEVTLKSMRQFVAKRPQHTVMDNARLREATGGEVRAWREALAQSLAGFRR